MCTTMSASTLGLDDNLEDTGLMTDDQKHSRPVVTWSIIGWARGHTPKNQNARNVSLSASRCSKTWFRNMCKVFSLNSDRNPPNGAIYKRDFGDTLYLTAPMLFFPFSKNLQGVPISTVSVNINTSRSHCDVMKVWLKKIGGFLSVWGLNVRF